MTTLKNRDQNEHESNNDLIANKNKNQGSIMSIMDSDWNDADSDMESVYKTESIELKLRRNKKKEPREIEKATKKEPREIDKTTTLDIDIKYDHNKSMEEHHSKVISSFISRLYTEKHLCDVILKVENEEYPAHKVVLAAHSPKLYNLFTEENEGKNIELVLNESTTEGLTAALCFIYTSKIVVSLSTVEDLLSASKQLGFQEITKLCSSFLLKDNTLAVFKKLEIAKQYRLDDVVYHLDQYINEHFIDIVYEADHLECSFACICDITSRDALHVISETDVFYAILAWLDKNRTKRMGFAVDALRNVRFLLMSPEDIATHVETSHVMKIPEIKAMVYRALRYHALLNTGCPLASVVQVPHQRKWIPETAEKIEKRKNSLIHGSLQKKKITKQYDRVQPKPEPSGYDEFPKSAEIVKASLRSDSLTYGLLENKNSNNDSVQPKPEPSEYYDYEFPKSAEKIKASPRLDSLTYGSFENSNTNPYDRVQPKPEPSEYYDYEFPKSAEKVKASPPLDSLIYGSLENNNTNLYDRVQPKPEPSGYHEFPKSAEKIKDSPRSLPIPPRPDSIYLVGGVTSLKQELYPIHAWETIAQYTICDNFWQEGATLPQPVHHHALVCIGQFIYVIGGSLFDPKEPTDLVKPIKDVHRYDISTGTWREMAPLNHARMYVEAVVLNDTIYAIGGQGDNGGVLTNMERYNKATDSWGVISNPSGHIGVAVTVHRGQVIVAGGYCRDTRKALKTVGAYDPDSNSWWKKNDMTVGRCHASLVDVKGTMYLIGGATKWLTRDAISSLGSINVYDDDADSWSHLTEMKLPRHDVTCAAIGSKIYIMGGISTQGNKTLSVVECFDTVTNSMRSEVEHLVKPNVGGAAVSLPSSRS